MSQSLHDSLLSCLDALAKLEKLQQLLHIALEQFVDFPDSPQKVRDRLEVLIDCYQSFAGNNLNQMQADLEQIRRQLPPALEVQEGE